MGFLTAVGITIGILAGLWTYGSLTLGLLTGAAFLSWGSWQARFALLAFIPGAFLGCAGFLGAGFDLKAILIAPAAGILLAYLSEVGANALVAATSSKKAAQQAA